ncbi:hypothetical protein [Microbacterium capsulatum]|uniref:Uncharacterized protein n=1 Tax=Microbacterium capsulatum TaxID=3041921 RepID=A0ABU0XE22_9MICO|nr:hypothetical protein [Microbacterium sp. ASV81]MDQ4213187.1 hypothetical protein [Microbacterium sp. ASV81]
MDNDARFQLEQHLGGLYHLLTRFESLSEQKEAVYQRHAYLYQPYKKKWRAGMYWLWVLIGTVALTALTPVVGSIVYSATTPSDTVASVLVGIVLFLLPFPLALIAAGVIVPVRNRRVPAMNARIEQSNQQAAVRIGELTAPEIHPIDRQLVQARREYSDGYAGWFPEKYLSSADVAACWQIVHDHRASTVQEAVNRLLTDQHEQYLRDAASAQLVEQQRATRVAQMNGIINATMQGAMIGAIRADGVATRAAIAAPRTVRIERR